MEVYKNKSSGEYFVFIEEKADDKILLVTPLNEIKALEPSLFHEPEEEDEAYLLSAGLITIQQVEKFKKFIKQDSMELFQRAIEDSDDDIPEKLMYAKKTMSTRQWDYAIADFIKRLCNELNLDR